MLRKIVFELVLLGIALGLTVNLVESAIPYLPLIWLLIMAHYTWELGASDYALRELRRVKAHFGDNRMTSYALVGLCGALLFCLYWWGLTTFFSPKIAAYEAEHKAQIEAQSYLVMSLVIDGVDENFVQFHFLLKNRGGPQQIKISHFMYKTSTNTAWDGVLEPVRTITPDGELTANGAAFKTEIPGKLSGRASYTIDGSEETKTVEYGFPVRLMDVQPEKILEPSSREEIPGETLVPTRAVLDGLKQPIGSMTFWFSERLPDGSPNYLKISPDPNRAIAFDPTSRRVYLTMPSNGKLFHLDRPLLEGKQGMHFVAATWDSAGNVHLYVDGSEGAAQPQ
jgi:hypothetical protein